MNKVGEVISEGGAVFVENQKWLSLTDTTGRILEMIDNREKSSVI